MTYYQYQAHSGQTAAWAMLILGVVCETPWISTSFLVVAAVQSAVSIYWGFKVREERHEALHPHA